MAACSDAAKKVFALADDLRPGTSNQCFFGSEEELKRTEVTQPCLFTVELAAAAALEEAGIRADMVAGFSLGELAALAWSGAVDLADGLRLVQRRGALMQQAAEENPAFMAAVVKLGNEAVEAVCSRFDGVYPVNYNCPGQVTVAGTKERFAEFSKAVKAAGGRALPLKVSGGFHSPFMNDAAEGFRAELEGVNVGKPNMTLYSNCTGAPYGGEIQELLVKQICSPVQWERIVRDMIENEVDTFIEAGPGSTLCGLIGRIDPKVKCFAVGGEAGLKKCVEEVLGC